MIRIGELKKVFSPVRHENLRELLRYSAREFADDDAFIVKTKKGKEVSYEQTILADGTIIFDIVTSEIKQRCSFTEI